VTAAVSHLRHLYGSWIVATRVTTGLPAGQRIHVASSQNHGRLPSGEGDWVLVVSPKWHHHSLTEAHRTRVDCNGKKASSQVDRWGGAGLSLRVSRAEHRGALVGPFRAVLVPRATAATARAAHARCVQGDPGSSTATYSLRAVLQPTAGGHILARAKPTRGHMPRLDALSLTITWSHDYLATAGARSSARSDASSVKGAARTSTYSAPARAGTCHA